MGIEPTHKGFADPFLLQLSLSLSIPDPKPEPFCPLSVRSNEGSDLRLTSNPRDCKRSRSTTHFGNIRQNTSESATHWQPRTIAIVCRTRRRRPALKESATRLQEVISAYLASSCATSNQFVERNPMSKFGSHIRPPPPGNPGQLTDELPGGWFVHIWRWTWTGHREP